MNKFHSTKKGSWIVAEKRLKNADWIGSFNGGSRVGLVGANFELIFSAFYFVRKWGYELFWFTALIAGNIHKVMKDFFLFVTGRLIIFFYILLGINQIFIMSLRFPFFGRKVNSVLFNFCMEGKFLKVNVT